MNDESEVRRCPDCGVPPGVSHTDGCDVARCTVCGFQRISDDECRADDGWGEIWTGEWPGDSEIAEGLARDHNDLHHKAMFGEVAWDGKRWQKPAKMRAGEV